MARHRPHVAAGIALLMTKSNQLEPLLLRHSLALLLGHRSPVTIFSHSHNPCRRLDLPCLAPARPTITHHRRSSYILCTHSFTSSPKTPRPACHTEQRPVDKSVCRPYCAYTSTKVRRSSCSTPSAAVRGGHVRSTSGAVGPMRLEIPAPELVRKQLWTALNKNGCRDKRRGRR